MFQIEKLQKALDYGVITKTKESSVLWDKSSSLYINNNDNDNECDNNISLHSSGYGSLQASQDRVSNEDVNSSEESWDLDVFDPQRPYCKQFSKTKLCHFLNLRTSDRLITLLAFFKF
jgi:hypothetical protein